MITTRIPQIIRHSMYLTFALSFFTGVLFFCLKTWFSIEGEFGLQKHPWQFPSLQVHAASAFVFILGFGALLSTHVFLSWRTKRKRKSGISLLVCACTQIISAYGLYYAANPLLRALIEYTHLTSGILLVCCLLFHLRKNKA